MADTAHLAQDLLDWLVARRRMPVGGAFHDEDVLEFADAHEVAPERVSAVLAYARDAGWVRGRMGTFVFTALGYAQSDDPPFDC